MTREEQIKQRAHQLYGGISLVCEQTYIDACRWTDSHPQWINVRDELPCEKDIVLTTNERGGISMGYYINGEWHNIMFADRQQEIPVTHWIPLPKRPSNY